MIISVIHLAKNHVHSIKTKHIDVCYYHLRDVKDSVMTLVKVDTRDNRMDMLTNVVPRIKFEHCLNLI